MLALSDLHAVAIATRLNQVRAVLGGIPEGSPASQNWKVKKKTKK